MRLAFSLSILALAIYYTWVAFTGLDGLTPNGRLGPGFFPRVIGVALVATVLYSLVADRRAELGSEGAAGTGVRDLVIFAALSFGFVALLSVLGGLLAMAVFMFAALTIFNRGRLVQNLLVSLALPVSVFLLFDTWLNAGLPEGILSFLG